jgi:hypothetical protein
VFSFALLCELSLTGLAEGDEFPFPVGVLLELDCGHLQAMITKSKTA